ncbi:hypothetical protein GCM10027418_11620 [Mariniluteicoccus endophyticus]
MAAQALADQRQAGVHVETSPELIAASFAAIEHLRVDGREPQGWAPLSGFFETGEGWVRLHANYPHHAAAITRALGVETRDELQCTLRERSALDVEEIVTAQQGIGVAVRTVSEWRAHPHGRATANEPWVAVREGADRPALPPVEDAPPLAGVRVLDLTRVIAGPTCSQLLACLGADVLRIDPPAMPELLDQHLSNGMGKRSATLDLNVHRNKLEALVPAADVVLLGYRPGSLTRFGLDPDDLLARHPHLIIASLSAWGTDGPWSHRAGFDSIVQAACGIAAECRNHERPGALPVQALDHSTGYLMAAHVLQLLRNARAGVMRASLLGAARTLLAYPPPPAEPPELLRVDTVAVASPHGQLTLTPPPLTLDGATLAPPVAGYAQANPAWITTAAG